MILIDIKINLSKVIQPGTIYFVEERDLLGFATPNYVKIGLVKDNLKGRSSDDRKDEHQTGNPRPLVVVDSINTEANVSTLETMIHQSLAMYRHRGEWFVKPNGELKLFIDKAKYLNDILSKGFKKLIDIDALSKEEDNGIEIDTTKEIIEIHNELININLQLKKIDERKKIIELTLRNLTGNIAKNIEGICCYKFKKGSSRLDNKKFEIDHPKIFEKLAKESINPNFNLKRQSTFKKSQKRIELENNIKMQKNNGHLETLDNNQETKNLHHQWLYSHVLRQPLESKRDDLISNLKLICGTNYGIKDICSWSRKKIKKVSKSDLKDFDNKFIDKYIYKSNDGFSFSVNPFRPYKFN